MTLIPNGHLLAQSIFNAPSPGAPYMVVTGHEGIFSGTADEEAEIIAEGIWDGTSSLLSQMDAQTILSQVNVYRNVGGTIFVGQWNGSLPGGESASVATPPQVAVLIQKQSGLAGRRNRGRMYIPSPDAAQVGEDGVLAPSALTAWQATADSFLSLCNSENLPLVILHESAPDTATPVTALSVQALVATQRRRLR